MASDRLDAVEGVKSALGSLRLIREKVGSEEGSLYLDQPRATRSGKPAFRGGFEGLAFQSWVSFVAD